VFKGYLEWSGTELVNIERTEAYVRNLAPAVLNTVGGLGALHIVGGDREYRSPLLDSAPWVNPFDPATDQFYGAYPLDVIGIGDSTYSATTTESVGAGGTTQGGRHASRDVKVSALLVGATELGAEAGLTWLRSALQTADCSDKCGGSLRYFLAEPAVCEVAWGEETGQTARAQFGAVAAGERIRYRWTHDDVDPTMPSHATWSTNGAEGVRVQYGATATDGEELWSRVVEPYRVNYVPNPAFRTSTAGFTGDSVAWSFDGGVDDAASALIGIDSSPTSATSDLWPSPAGVTTVSWSSRSDSGALVTARLLDGVTGAILASTQYVAGDDQERQSLTGTSTGGVKLQFDTTDSFSLDQVLCEHSDVALPYFDGQSDLDGYLPAWVAAADASSSTLTLTDPMELVADDSDYRPYFEVIAGTAQGVRLTWTYRRAIDVLDQLLPIDRALHNVSVTQAPVIVQRVDATATGGGYFIQVEFLFNAGNPFSYSQPVEILTVPLVQAPYSDPPSSSLLDDDWLFDPSALVPSAPPAAPDIVADAVDPSITSWQRYYIDIPADKVADWASTVPIVQFNTHGAPVRQIRVRFHPNPFDYPAVSVDPVGFCADFLISYLPAGTSLLLNGITQTALASKAGVASVPADSILYGSDGGPMTWPHLSCGIAYVMTIDVPSSGDYDLFDIELQMLREE
jgi:hypothetical protein